MLDREDMLELTRRMTPSRNCFGRVAGSYRDEEGGDLGSFNTFFLGLKSAEKEKQLAIAKAIPYARTNEEIREYKYPADSKKSREVWKLLVTLNECELKNDALLETFYDYISDRFFSLTDYAIFVYHGTYDVPVKGKDKEWLEGSEEVYSFIICAICPVTEGEPGKPECGFLYPSFANHSCDNEHIAVFDANPDDPHLEFIKDILAIND